MRHTESAGGVVLNRKDEVLVVSQHGSTWSLPKGHIDPGEDALTAAKREIREEAGIEELTLLGELGSYGRHKIGLEEADDLSEQKTIHLFLFRTTQMALKPLDPRHPEARWVKKEAVAGLLTHRKDKEFFLSIIDKIK